MSFFSGNIRSRALMMDTQMQVILPQDGKFYTGNGEPPKTLILLHGLSDNAASWVRYTAIERYAEHYNLCVAMPEVQRSFYTDMKCGLSYETYIAEELPDILRKLFTTSVTPGNLIIAGLSMGGYGALKCALKYPDRFTQCGAFSAVIDPIPALNNISTEQAAQSGGKETTDKDWRGIFGSDKNLDSIKDFDLNYMLSELPHTKLPRIFMTCGKEDFLYSQNKKFAGNIKQYPEIDFIFKTWKGIHEWGFWDKSVEMMLAYFLAPDV